MAPPAAVGERDLEGIWGAPTATIDWCEANYEVTPYIAEFWNTISNVVMIVLPLVGAAYTYKDGFELRYVLNNLALAVVGIGSWCFHGTLLYEMQLLDELPMIWGSTFLLYGLIEIDAPPRSRNIPVIVGLVLYCLVVTVVYLTIKQPVFHEVAYALMVFGMVFYSVKIVRKYEHLLWLIVVGLVSYGTGFLLWNIDNILCSQLRELRSDVSSPVRPLLQGHAWWHILTGYGTYMGIMFSTHARAKYLRRDPEIQYMRGILPLLRLPSKDMSSSTSVNNNLYKNGQALGK